MNKIYIKNMVCNRCIMAVQTDIEKLGLAFTNIELGEVTLVNELTEVQKIELRSALQRQGFELIDDRKSRLIERIKTLIIELVHQRDNELNINLSDYLSADLHQDYNYISGLFSEVEGITIEKYFIAQKIEKVKELLVYNELSLTEIAWRLNYSGVAHLSNQFKKTTGLTPTHFKNIRSVKRKPLDEI